MFEEYFGLKEKPFSKTPDPRFLYLSKSHEEALARLQYAVEEREMVLLTGEVGCGKTTLTRALMDELDENYNVALIINPRLSPTQFLRLIAKRFDIDSTSRYREEIIEAIYERIYELNEEGITPVIIIDEAQLIPRRETFEEIRLLTNFQLDHVNLLSIILVAQPDIKRRFKHRVYKPLLQRISLYYHLPPLSEEETKEYILHRLRIAGRKSSLFTDEAIHRIYEYSEGIPRLINSIATNAMLEAIERDKDLIDEECVINASKELEILRL
jgi:type II secretory pathway predicted ATPase ExeA